MIFYRTKTGNYHKKKSKECEDIVKYCETEKFIITAIADGATMCKFGKLGAFYATEAAIDFVKIEENSIFSYSERELCYLLTEHIIYTIEKNEGTDRKKSEYGSTLTMAVMRKNDGKVVIVKIGNGKCVINKKNRAYDPFDTRNVHKLAYLTTTDMAYRAASVSYEQFEYGEYAVICTDGMLSLLQKKYTNKTMTRILKNITPLQLTNYLEDSDEEDDAGFLILTRMPPDKEILQENRQRTCLL